MNIQILHIGIRSIHLIDSVRFLTSRRAGMFQPFQRYSGSAFDGGYDAAQAGFVAQPSVSASPGTAKLPLHRMLYGRITKLVALPKRSAARPMPR
jgi:hypothetical protein